MAALVVVGALGVSGLLLRGSEAAMSSAPLLQIRVTIPGVTDGMEGGAIMADSFSWGVSQTLASGGGGGAGRIRVSEITITKTSDKASPILLKACANGEHFREVTIEMRKAGGTGGSTPLQVYHMEDVIISSFQIGGNSQSDRPTESISFVYAKISVEYVEQEHKVELDCTEFPYCVALARP